MIKQLIVFFVILIPFSSIQTSGSIFETQEISWRDLRKLNVKTGEMPRTLKKILGRSIKIPGYAVPIEGDGGFDFITEFKHNFNVL